MNVVLLIISIFGLVCCLSMYVHLFKAKKMFEATVAGSMAGLFVGLLVAAAMALAL